MTKEKQQKLDEIESQTQGTIPIDIWADHSWLITELKAAWQREEDLLKGLDSIREIILEK